MWRSLVNWTESLVFKMACKGLEGWATAVLTNAKPAEGPRVGEPGHVRPRNVPAVDTPSLVSSPLVPTLPSVFLQHPQQDILQESNHIHSSHVSISTTSCLWLHLMKNGRLVSRWFEAGPAAGMAVWQLLGLVTIGGQHALTVASGCLANTMLSCCSNRFSLQPSRAKLSQSRADKCHNRDADYDNQKIEAFVTSGRLRGLVRQAGHTAAGSTHFFSTFTLRPGSSPGLHRINSK